MTALSHSKLTITEKASFLHPKQARKPDYATPRTINSIGQLQVFFALRPRPLAVLATGQLQKKLITLRKDCAFWQTNGKKIHLICRREFKKRFLREFKRGQFIVRIRQ
jgi:hypothetical protein